LAADCPHTVEILKLAAQTELKRAFRLPADTNEATDLGAIEERRNQSRERALEWIERAAAESRLRGDDAPPHLDYLRGNALLAQGDYQRADESFQRAIRYRGIEPFRVRRMMALTALFRGDIAVAQRLSFRALIDTPKGTGHMTSRYIHALVLERSGDPSNARLILTRTLNQDGDRSVFGSLVLVLPLHERVYLEALKAEALNDEPRARRLWSAYLASEHPEDPERRLAERHLSELQVLPNKL
jgi:tetratricopeptide (TPR) repeat protein